MKLGIVGLPNVGKSTLFNSLTKAGAESANYPFCTIDPNVGVVAVPDERLKLLGHNRVCGHCRSCKRCVQRRRAGQSIFEPYQGSGCHCACGKML